MLVVGCQPDVSFCNDAPRWLAASFIWAMGNRSLPGAPAHLPRGVPKTPVPHLAKNGLNSMIAEGRIWGSENKCF